MKSRKEIERQLSGMELSDEETKTRLIEIINASKKRCPKCGCGLLKVFDGTNVKTRHSWYCLACKYSRPAGEDEPEYNWPSSCNQK